MSAFILGQTKRAEISLRPARTPEWDNESGHVYVCSEIDLILIFLPALIETVKFTTADGLLRLRSAPGLPHLFTEASLGRLERVCDKKSVGSHNVVRLNQDKLKVWLKQRVDNICRFANELSTSGERKLLHSLLSVQSQSSASAPLFASDSKSAKALASTAFDGDGLRTLAFEIVADNFPVALIEQLHNDLGLKTLSCADKENMATGQPSDSISESNAHIPKTVTPSMAKKQKFARGSKSIMSFFSKQD
ncbi:unnamed protein product [Dibothriocephalus latus]|uniref:Ribonuclease H2 subunit B wHTH domain-containing protein n=1 Tax=Dibothriocephalus latus TaxID=60516 RepID=A0A3P7NQ08_DIBLA|nr:unnamed protein product [Dibothriocephalus latus]